MTGLARCVGDAGGFLARQWGRGPVHTRSGAADAFADLFTLDDVDHIVSSTSPRQPAFRLVRDGTPLDPARYTRTARIGGRTVPGVGDPGRIFDELRAGATIVLQGLQRTWPPLTRFCRALELELTHPVQANAYVTPAGARGLGVHYDTHDVFVLQVAGTKQWAVFDPVLADPLPSQPWRARDGFDPGEPLLSVDLRAGECLYVPRGFLHSARAQDELSAHLTIGVHAQTWHDVVREAVAGTAAEPMFRRSLPVGFAADDAGFAEAVDETVAALRDWLEKLDPRAVADSFARRFWAGRPPILAGQLHQLALVERLDDRSRLRRRAGSVCRRAPAGPELAVVLGDRELRMPAALEPVVGRMTTGDPFRLGDLEGFLDEPSRLVLARRLVLEGLLEIVDGG